MSDDFNAATKFRSLTGAARAIERGGLILLTLVAAAWAGLMLIISLLATIGVLWLLPVREEHQA